MTVPFPLVPAVPAPALPADPAATWGSAALRFMGAESAPGTTMTADRPDAATIATALRDAGFVAAACAVARLGDDARTGEWDAIAVADAALAAAVAAHGVPAVPSVQVREDGAPRFVVAGGDAATLVADFDAEHRGSGVDAELRLFLDEALQPGDGYVDAAPGAGWAVLTAATRPGVQATALVDDRAVHEAIVASARASGCAATVAVRRRDEATAIVPGGANGLVVLHAGRAAEVAPLLQALRAADPAARIDAVAWRCGTARDADYDAEGLQVAAAVLGVLGFRHFALAASDDGVELVPAEAMASNTMIFSLGAAFLARAGA